MMFGQKLQSGRKYFLFLLAALLFIQIPACGQKKKAGAVRQKNSASVKLRYNYKPVQTQKYSFELSVKSSFNSADMNQDVFTTITSHARIIPFKIDSASRMHLMAMLDDPVVVMGTGTERDTVHAIGWGSRRVELVIDSLGVLKQRFEIDKFPAVQITGFARPDDNALHVLLSSLLPRLPDSVTFSKPTQFIHLDSVTTTYPTKVIRRTWKERKSVTLLERNDSLSTCSFESRIDATEFIFPKGMTAARVTEDRISRGKFSLSGDGKLLTYKYSTTIYKKLVPIATPSAGIEEESEIHFELRRL